MTGADQTLPAARPAVPGPFGRLLARAYGAAIRKRNRRFDAGRGVVGMDRPVISVGNLSVGGTGKTPMVAHLLRVLLDAGRRPCVAMRGYASRNGESDEAAEYARRFPDVPVVARANRVDGLIELFASPRGAEVDCIVLDDGFQHRRLARRLDIVLIDATRDPFTDSLLPAGWLREPVGSLGRAHFAVITHAESVSPAFVARLKGDVVGQNFHLQTAVARHTWSALELTGAGAPGEAGLEWLNGRSVVAVCAIGNPGPFLDECRRRTGGKVAAEIVLRDHDPYAAPTIARIIDTARRTAASAIVTTGKDWSKLRHVLPDRWPCPVARPRLRLEFAEGGAALDEAVLEAAAGTPA